MTTRRSRSDRFRRAAALLDQQLWCWGRDVVRPEGNLLLELGMCRHRPTESRPEGTAYTGRVDGESEVWLWGFGLAYCHPELGGVFLRRYRFDPMLMARPPERPVHAPERLGPLIRPTTASQRATVANLVRAAAGWVGRYEHWVAETLGTAYREATLAARDKPRAVPAGDMAGAWDHLAKKSGRLIAPGAPRRGPWGELLAALKISAPRPGPDRRRGPAVVGTDQRLRAARPSRPPVP